MENILLMRKVKDCYVGTEHHNITKKAKKFARQKISLEESMPSIFISIENHTFKIRKILQRHARCRIYY